MERPKGFRDTFSRPHLVRENEHFAQTRAKIHATIESVQQQVIALQQRLGAMRTDGQSSLDQQSQIIFRIQQLNNQIDDMGRQIGKADELIIFNRDCIRYIDWLRGENVDRH